MPALDKIGEPPLALETVAVSTFEDCGQGKTQLEPAFYNAEAV